MCQIIVKNKYPTPCILATYLLFLHTKMLSKKLTTYLRTFSLIELRKLSKFIMSPYHNENQELSRFYEIIKPYYINQEAQMAPTKKKVWSELYPSKKYDDQKLRKLASLVLNLAIEFKSLELLEKQPTQKLLLKLKAVSQPNLSTHIASINRKLDLEKSTSNTILSHFYQFEINTQNHLILELQNNRKKLLEFENLNAADKHLHIFFYAQKLAIIADIIGYQGFMNIKNQTSHHQFLASLPQSPYFLEPIVQVYYLVVLMLSNPDVETHFFKLKNWLYENKGKFSTLQKKIFYSHLVNYCISHKINKGSEDFYQQVFDVFTVMVSERLIFDPHINSNYFNNIIVSSIKLEKFEYAQNFISEYSHFLPPDQKENAKTYNLARVYYKQKNYEKVLELLHNVELTNLSYALGAKTILVGTYFALDEYRALESLLISFRIFILRNKILAKNTKQGYLNFLKFTKKIISLAPYDKEGKEKLKHKIGNTQNLMVRDWLLEQIEAF